MQSLLRSHLRALYLCVFVVQSHAYSSLHGVRMRLSKTRHILPGGASMRLPGQHKPLFRYLQQHRMSSTDSTSRDQMEPSYIETDELAELLSDTDSQTVVVDVRDDDFYGGNIPGARNVPSRMWMNTSTVTELVNDLKDADTVVFHCMLSQVRGPTCARQFLSTMKDMNLEGKPSVKVLYEGFKGWRRRYRANPFMIENDDI